MTVGVTLLLTLTFIVIINSPNHSEVRAPQASTYTR